MQRDNILHITEVMDESQKLRRRFQPLNGCDWIPTGRYMVLRENGTQLLEISYQDGVLHGPFASYWPNGKASSEGQHKEGKQDGVWHFYNKDGTIHAIIQFKEDKEIDSTQYIYDMDGTPSDIIRFSKKEREKKRGRD